jgi:hypothetical protein
MKPSSRIKQGAEENFEDALSMSSAPSTCTSSTTNEPEDGQGLDLSKSPLMLPIAPASVPSFTRSRFSHPFWSAAHPPHPSMSLAALFAPTHLSPCRPPGGTRTNPAPPATATFSPANPFAGSPGSSIAVDELHVCMYVSHLKTPGHIIASIALTSHKARLPCRPCST